MTITCPIIGLTKRHNHIESPPKSHRSDSFELDLCDFPLPWYLQKADHHLEKYTIVKFPDRIHI